MFNPERRYTIDAGKTTQFSEAWVILALMITAAGLALGSALLTAAAATMLVIAGAAWLWNRWSLRGLHYGRRFSETRAFPGEVVELALSVQNHKPLPLTWLVVRDTFPEGLPVDEQSPSVNPATNLAAFTTFWMPGAYQRITRRFQLRCVRRGYFRFGPATLETGDGFGFFESHHALPAQERLIVYPRLYSVAELRLPTKNPFGAPRARLQLYEDPLRTAGAREWQQSDSLRRIHWSATARTQELFSRVYEPSEEIQVQIFLNVATLERHWQGVITELHERAISVAGSLAAYTLGQRLATGLIANGSIPGSDQELRLLPGRSANQLLHILELLAAVTPFASSPIEELLHRESPRLPWGASLVVVTAIAHAELLVTLRELADVGRRVVLVTLAQKPPPTDHLGSVVVFHLPHLVDDLIAPYRITPEKVAP